MWDSVRTFNCGIIHIGGQKMDTDIIFKLAGIGILVAIINQLLVKSGRDEQAMLVVIAGLVVAMVMMVEQISMLFNTIKSTFGF